MQWFAGTSDYSYKEWKGSFYPDDCKSQDMLAFYASCLSAVEINNTDTAGWLYLRLRQPGYTPQKLAGWIKPARATDAASTFAFFKHEDAGAGPQLAARLATLAQRPQAQRAPRKQRSGSTKRPSGRAS